MISTKCLGQFNGLINNNTIGNVGAMSQFITSQAQNCHFDWIDFYYAPTQFCLYFSSSQCDSKHVSGLPVKSTLPGEISRSRSYVRT